ncbi:MAG: sugar transferase [Chloroflexota bacterium]|nr:sugar transferase [Chloroflexota bacterium]
MVSLSNSGTVPAASVVAIAPTRPAYRLAKRALDVTAGTLGLVVTAPVMLGLAAAIKLESPGPALFRQQRVGLGGRPFLLYKFRSMHASADEDQHRRYVAKLLAEPRHAGTWVPIEQDARVTRVGQLLRRTHLDELPQLLNIVRGEMSLVGPRPPIPYEVELYKPWQLRRLSVVPGLTGLWQVEGWGRLSFDEGVALDLAYIERRSIWLDLTILVRTVWQILAGRQF